MFFDVTHGNPGEIYVLLEFLAKSWTDSAVQISQISEKWMSRMQSIFFNEICNRFRGSTGEALNEFDNFLTHWFSEPCEMAPPGPLTDTGILYQEFTNLGAVPLDQLIEHFWCTS